MFATLRIQLIAAVMILGQPLAQGTPRSTDGTDPDSWDPKLDATLAAPRNHKVIYEDENIRVLSVSVQPGEVVALHHHRWPSVIVYDRPAKSENRDARGNVIPRRAAAASAEWPPVIRLPPEAAHSITNVDTVANHLIRVEFKKGIAPR